jgi:hypothetical protein
LTETFKLDISEGLTGNKTVNLQSLDNSREIAMFLFLLNACNGIDGTACKSERVSIDTENLLFALQAQSLQIYTELAKRRNEEVKNAHLPQLDLENHSDDGLSRDRGKKFLKFSFPRKPAKDKLIPRSKKLGILRSAKALKDFLKDFSD